MDEILAEGEMPRVGDTVKVTGFVSGVVTSVDASGFRVGGTPFYWPPLNEGIERTVEVVKRAEPPWQAGDICQHKMWPNIVLVRQMNGFWVSTKGQTDCLADEYADSNYTPIIRGGRRVTS